MRLTASLPFDLVILFWFYTWDWWLQNVDNDIISIKAMHVATNVFIKL
jgi:hypothetical protein